MNIEKVNATFLMNVMQHAVTHAHHTRTNELHSVIIHTSPFEGLQFICERQCRDGHVWLDDKHIDSPMHHR